MPKYDYDCPNCHIRVEISARYEQQLEDIVVRCWLCGQWMVRQIQAVPIIFKGPGFYSTDNQEEHKKEE